MITQGRALWAEQAREFPRTSGHKLGTNERIVFPVANQPGSVVSREVLGL